MVRLCHDNLRLLLANGVVRVRHILVLLEMTRRNTFGVQLIKLLKPDSLGFGVQPPTEDGDDETEPKEDEADFATQVTRIRVDLERDVSARANRSGKFFRE